MIKIIEYLQGSFCSFSQTRDNWPFNTGIEIFWLEMHIKSMMWLLIYLTENDCQWITNNWAQRFLRIWIACIFSLSEFPQPYPLDKLSHIRRFGLFTHHKNIKVFSRSRIWDISHESKKPNSLTKFSIFLVLTSFK